MAAVRLLCRAPRAVSKATVGVQLGARRLLGPASCSFSAGPLAEQTLWAGVAARGVSSSSTPDVCEKDVRHSRKFKVPTLKEVESMPAEICEMSSMELVILAEQGLHEACAERLTREIMRTDGVEWVVARTTLREIRDTNRKVIWMATLPHHVGIFVALTTGIGCIPLIFHRGCAEWFNMKFVSADIPDEKDLETIYEVGSWTWGWMEPPLGTISFFLLCIQFAREQRFSIGGKPITERIQDQQANKMVEAFPQYDETIVRAYAASIALHDDEESIAAEQSRIERLLLEAKEE